MHKLQLWYRAPAGRWEEALPIGNGRMGAMVFGRFPEERLQLNEETLWSGGPYDPTHAEALEHLPEVRRLLLEGKYVQAEELANRYLMGRPLRMEMYQPLGDLWVRLEGEWPNTPTEYRRELDLETAVARQEVRIEGVQIVQEAFLSAPDDLLVYRIESSRPLDLTLALTSPHRFSVEATEGRLLLSGEVLRGITRFAALLEAVSEDGTVHGEGDRLRIRDARSVTLRLTAATSYRTPTYRERCAEILRAAPTDYQTLKRRHQEDHGRLFRRVRLSLEGEEQTSHLPSDERLRAVQEGEEDLGLVPLYFQYGRYLLIASSRPGTLPANLQGIWNDRTDPPWGSKWTLNINAEMNYWHAETTALPECHQAFLEFIASLVESGSRTAERHYGCRGWTVHHNTDLWRATTPCDGAGWGLWPMGAAWLCQHLWEHYAFSGDRSVLERYYPVMREAARFILDFLIEDETGCLVTCPSTSPENRFLTPEGERAGLCVSATMDRAIIEDLFGHCIQAAELLGRDQELVAEMQAVLPRLVPYRIGRFGQLQEWREDFEEAEPGHRHMSHLFGLHPGSSITPEGTPELAAAARRSLERRLEHGGGGTGWSRAWVVNFWARLHEGNAAWEHLLELFRRSTLPNFFDNHPPFQIDGNFGGAAGIAEMLLQSHAGEVHLLPALPDAWRTGVVEGLRARGGITMNLRWKEGRLLSAELQTARSGSVRLRHPRTVRVEAVLSGEEPVPFQCAGAERVHWEGAEGGSYLVRFCPVG
ncbi:MAG: alpha/beta hydrolase [Candidatus Poribacteria bacterium]|nr:MAG: alpha/beta hydrolase [Candidatus Poribacteria bacterium]